MSTVLILSHALLVAALIVALRYIRRLRIIHRHRGLVGTWPVPIVSLDAFDARFRPDALGPTRASEVTFIGRGTLRVAGGTSDAESWVLAVLAKDARLLFEFGTCTGRTTYLWARNAPADARIVTLTLGPSQLDAYRAESGDDPADVAAARAESRFERFLYSGTDVEHKVTQLFGDSKTLDLKEWAGRCDVVFVDGSHAYSYARSDGEKALCLVRPGGVVLWHDYSPRTPGVFRALNELAQRLKLIHLDGTSLVAYRA